MCLEAVLASSACVRAPSRDTSGCTYVTDGTYEELLTFGLSSHLASRAQGGSKIHPQSVQDGRNPYRTNSPLALTYRTTKVTPDREREKRTA